MEVAGCWLQVKGYKLYFAASVFNPIADR